MNQNGGSICDIVNRFVKIVHAVSDKTLDSSTVNISLKGNILHDRNQLFTIHNIRDDIYIIKNNDNCITSSDANYRLAPIDMRASQVFRIVKLPDNTYVIHHINNGLCIDANWDQDILAKECIADDNNQKFYITPYFKNNDNNFNHIKASLQNLILSFTPIDIELDSYFPLMFEEGTILNISQKSLHLHPRYGVPDLTYSAILCPLIYNALKKAGVNVIDVWTALYIEAADGSYQPATPEVNLQFQIYSELIANTPGWVNYALFILTEYEYKDNLEPEFNEPIFAESKSIVRYLKANGKL
jgi:hypothetical protein